MSIVSEVRLCSEINVYNNDSGVRPQTVDMGNACEGFLKESWQGILEEKS